MITIKDIYIIFRNYNTISVFGMFEIYSINFFVLQTYLLDSAKPRAWEYEGHVYSDNTCENIIQQTVRAKLLDILPNEVPYRLQVKLEHFDPAPDDSVKAMVSVTCPSKRIARLLTRHSEGNDNRIAQVAKMTEEVLRHAFRTSVRLKLSVQSPK